MLNKYVHVTLRYKTGHLNFVFRKISKYLDKDISSKVIREKFLNYFIEEKGHKFVKSSPVIPFCDPTVPFVNAGMNQFKGIFLGLQTPQYPKVVNSQKCIRIGGKHNDLNNVGRDGYHHTFFEMLGNWSFGNYFKKEACQMAWELLTKVYKLPASRLYVTYFSGNTELNLPPDEETKHIWSTIGVEEERILPFGETDNFWEMGLVGPCGPCTEIHYDHMGTVNRAQLVNRGLHDLTEIWNIVFIEHNRKQDGSVQLLPKKHIDTGLGFERLTCALQGKNCSGISEYSGHFGEQDWNNVDMSYRTLADHVRMITVSLGDGAIPEQNHKLRRILRKCFYLSETVFKKDKGLTKELSNYVVENLGQVYPEIERNVDQIHQIIDYEENVYHNLRKSSEKELQKLIKENAKLTTIDPIDIAPNVLTAYKELHESKCKIIDDKLAYRLYDTHGMDEELILQVSNVLDIEFNPLSFAKGLDDAKLESKKKSAEMKFSINIEPTIPRTDDSSKYFYSKGRRGYSFPPVECKVLNIIQNDLSTSEAGENCVCSLILDKTNMYCAAGGQDSDRGTIIFEHSQFDVKELLNIDGRILHRGVVRSGTVRSGSLGTIKPDEAARIANMCNHTGTHLLNAAVKKIKRASCQKSSKVTDSYLNLDVAIFGAKLDISDVVSIEDTISSLIKKQIEVKVSIVDSQQLYKYDEITLIPGEVYPDNNIRIIEVTDGSAFISREPCCGTHVLNTSDLEDFCVIGMKSLGRSTQSVTAVTGDRAKLARQNAVRLSEEISLLKKSLGDNMDKPELIEVAVGRIKKKLNFDARDNTIIPLVFKDAALADLQVVNGQLKQIGKQNLKNFIEMEMEDALQSNIGTSKSNKKYIVHYLRSSVVLDSVPLQKATKLCPNMPVLIVSYSDNIVKARCCVPKEFQNEYFDAQTWLTETVATVFDSEVRPSKNQAGDAICNMKPKKVHIQEWDTLLKEAMKLAKKYVHDNL
ncbi:alanine--tRNA ligase, mitochondrial isoform X2 [Cylas formicarius]|uniref:alanine--tRNA ligase, mitochondrial isoform X2 n=1 Tax=Cylas formicarius TaxID=197179 RepID=UPI002958CA5B|nr:alanine--tRNA ligase, mitochondrial isoform X2 [Cylas formicarius]